MIAHREIVIHRVEWMTHGLSIIQCTTLVHLPKQCRHGESPSKLGMYVYTQWTIVIFRSAGGWVIYSLPIHSVYAIYGIVNVTHIHIRTDTQSHTHIFTQIHIRTHIYIHIYIYTYTLIYTHTHVPTHPHTFILTYTYTHTFTYTHTHTHKHMHSHKQLHRYTYQQIYMYTYMHIHKAGVTTLVVWVSEHT